MKKLILSIIFLLSILLLGASVENGDLVSTADVSKIDSAATDGLTGTVDSLAYRIEEIEKHIHNTERWFGLHGSPSGEVTRMQAIGSTTTPFQMDAGNNTWGSWLQIVGSGDTPISGTNAYFDVHQIEIVARERNSTTHFVQIGCDTSGANALSNGNYTESMFRSTTALGFASPLDTISIKYEDTTKCWIRVWAVGQNTGTVDFFIGIIEYEG